MPRFNYLFSLRSCREHSRAIREISGSAGYACDGTHCRAFAPGTAQDDDGHSIRRRYLITYRAEGEHVGCYQCATLRGGGCTGLRASIRRDAPVCAVELGRGALKAALALRRRIATETLGEGGSYYGREVTPKMILAGMVKRPAGAARLERVLAEANSVRSSRRS
jgi:hypothetical protein